MMIRKKIILPFFIIVVSFFVTGSPHCLADIDIVARDDTKTPIFQSKSYKECIRKSGVDMSWVEIVKTENYTHYINREVEHALVYHDSKMLIFVIKGTKDISIILGQEYSDKTQSWMLFGVDIYDDYSEFTQFYRKMLYELTSLIHEPKSKCIIKNN